MASLEALVVAGHRVELVVTQPDRPGHRLRTAPPAVKVAAGDLGLEVFQPEHIGRPESVERLYAAAPDVLVVAAYGQIVPPAVLEVPRLGPVNVHASLLPRWRGAAPVAHAILSGDRVTGITIMRMDETLDHGPVLASAQTQIGEHEDAAFLTERLSTLGAVTLVETLPRLEAIVPVEQDHGAATYAPKLGRKDGEVEWELDASDLDRHVRAFQPWPGVTVPFGDRRVKVLRGRPAAGVGRPGQVLSTAREGVEVACGRGSYLLQEVQLPGRRPMPARTLVTGDA